MAKEEAEKRGWTGEVSADGPTELAKATMKVWQEWKITTQYEDFTIEDVVADMRVRLALSIQIDPMAPIEGKTVSFRVNELQADQAIDLITKLSDLAWAVDPLGTTWVTTKERVPAIRRLKSDGITQGMDVTMQMIRVTAGVEPVPEKVRDERGAKAMAEWLADRRVDMSIVNLPAEEAITKLAEASDLMIWEWSEAAKQAAAESPLVSLVGDRLPLGEALEGMLKGAGVVLDCAAGGMARVETPEERRDRLDENGELARSMALSRKQFADLKARRVRIEGRCLTLSMVLAQAGRRPSPWCCRRGPRLARRRGNRTGWSRISERCSTSWRATPAMSGRTRSSSTRKRSPRPARCRSGL